MAKDGSDELASELVGPESVRRVDRNDPENDSGGEKDEADDESDANDTVDTETDESAKSQDQVDDGPSDREIAATTPNIQTTSSQDPAPVEPLDDPALWNSVEEELFLPSETGGSSESPQDGGDFVLSGRQGSDSSLTESGQSDQSTTPPTSQDDVPLTLNPVCATFSAGLVVLSLSRPFHPSPPLPGLDEPTDDDSGAFRSRSQRRFPRGLRRRKTDARPASRQKPTQPATTDTTAEGSQPDHAKELINSEFARRAVLTLVNLARTENSGDSDSQEPSWLEDRLSQMAIGAAAVAATTGWLASRHQRSPSQFKTVLRLNPASMYTGPTVGLTEPGY
ncbi:MAG: hypothetical protein GXP27_14870 [Planctomycetes bacterium]|nr:hypothetical protein [Planctomycetota bacterium]